MKIVSHSWRRLARIIVIVLTLCCLMGPVSVLPAAFKIDATGGQVISGAALKEKVNAFRDAHEKEILREFVGLLAMPNLASDKPNIIKNGNAVADLLRRHGVASRILELEGAPPVVFGELTTPGAKSTVTFYAHYDGQPVDPSQWKGEPWVPVLRDNRLEAGGQVINWSALPAKLNPDWRLYARSASDDKAPIIGMVAALDALRDAKVPLSVNLKFFFEGEEEAGSPHLEQFLSRYAELLKTDLWILCDGPIHQTNRIQVVFGARGTTGLELTVYGPNRGLHSGHYGNWAPNPIVLLTHLIDSMRDTNARILINKFYEDVRPLTPREQQAVEAMPAVDDQLKKELALGSAEGDGATLAEQLMKPAINLRGIQSGHVGAQAANLIPTEASASIDFRLVPDETPGHIRELVEGHITKMGFYIVHDTPDAQTRESHAKVVKLTWEPGYPAARTDMDLPVSRAVVKSIEDVLGTGIIVCPSLGGSIPMYLFHRLGDRPVIIVPIANYDNNQHSSNENIRLGNLWDGIVIFAGLFAQLGPGIQAGRQ